MPAVTVATTITVLAAAERIEVQMARRGMDYDLNDEILIAAFDATNDEMFIATFYAIVAFDSAESPSPCHLPPSLQHQV